jgi:hypothetical protein
MTGTVTVQWQGCNEGMEKEGQNRMEIVFWKTVKDRANGNSETRDPKVSIFIQIEMRRGE